MLGRASSTSNPSPRPTPGDGELTDQKVAGYVGKYATKAAESTGTLDRPVVCWRCKGTGHDPDGSGLCKACHGRATRHDDVHHLVDNPHAQAMISACWTLGARPELEQLRLRPLGPHARIQRALLHPLALLLHHPDRLAPSPARLA